MSDYKVFAELADTWDAQSMDAKPAARRETLRECADALRMMVDFMSKPVSCPRAERLGYPWHYCIDCPEGTECELPGRSRP